MLPPIVIAEDLLICDESLVKSSTKPKISSALALRGAVSA
jgi:hypothetical protein